MKTQVIDEKEWPENRTAKIGLLVNKKTNKAFGKKKNIKGTGVGSPSAYVLLLFVNE